MGGDERDRYGQKQEDASGMKKVIQEPSDSAEENNGTNNGQSIEEERLF